MLDAQLDVLVHGSEREIGLPGWPQRDDKQLEKFFPGGGFHGPDQRFR
jgi:hypothetical protein